MSLWKLEWLRLRRTWRGIGLVALFVAFGLLGPLTARYLPELLENFGGGEVQVIFPNPKPSDGILQYVSNAQQMGLLTTVVVALGAFGFDARPDIATFLRTRVGITRLILVRYVLYLGFVSLAFTLGTLAAWYESSVLLGSLPAAEMLAGLGFAVVYYAFVLAMAAIAAGLTRGTVSGAVTAFGLVFVPSFLGVVPDLAKWLPFTLGTAIIDILDTGSITDYLPAVGVTLLVTPAALALAIRLLQRREL